MLLPGSAGGAVAVWGTLATTICRVADPMQVARPRQLRDASTVMRFRPAHQSMINRRHDDCASCSARHSLKHVLEIKPRIHAPATCKGGHESGSAVVIRASPYAEASCAGRFILKPNLPALEGLGGGPTRMGRRTSPSSFATLREAQFCGVIVPNCPFISLSGPAVK